MSDTRWDDLEQHLSRTTALPAPVVRRLVLDVVAYFDEAPEAFVRRRHRELQAAGRSNSEILPQIADELASRPVPGPHLTERQVRRIVYG